MSNNREFSRISKLWVTNSRSVINVKQCTLLIASHNYNIITWQYINRQTIDDAWRGGIPQTTHSPVFGFMRVLTDTLYIYIYISGRTSDETRAWRHVHTDATYSTGRCLYNDEKRRRRRKKKAAKAFLYKPVLPYPPVNINFNSRLLCNLEYPSI